MPVISCEVIPFRYIDVTLSKLNLNKSFFSGQTLDFSCGQTGSRLQLDQFQKLCQIHKGEVFHWLCTACCTRLSVAGSDESMSRGICLFHCGSDGEFRRALGLYIHSPIAYNRIAPTKSNASPDCISSSFVISTWQIQRSSAGLVYCVSLALHCPPGKTAINSTNQWDYSFVDHYLAQGHIHGGVWHTSLTQRS